MHGCCRDKFWRKRDPRAPARGDALGIDTSRHRPVLKREKSSAQHPPMDKTHPKQGRAPKALRLPAQQKPGPAPLPAVTPRSCPLPLQLQHACIFPMAPEQSVHPICKHFQLASEFFKKLKKTGNDSTGRRGSDPRDLKGCTGLGKGAMSRKRRGMRLGSPIQV